MVEIIKRGHRILVQRTRLHVIDAMDPIVAPESNWTVWIVGLGVGHRHGIVNRLGSIATQMAGRRLKRVVNSLVGQVKEKGLIGISCLEPIDGLIGQHIGRVTFKNPPLTVDVEFRIRVSALPLEADPMVKTGLSDHRDRVPCATCRQKPFDSLPAANIEGKTGFPRLRVVDYRPLDGGGMYCPVKMVARLGLQSEVVTKAFLK